MKTTYKQIFINLFFLTSFNIYGQMDANNYSDFYENYIDSLSAIIEEHDPIKIKLDSIPSIDSIIGEQIKTIEKQTFETIYKYTLRTNNSETGLSIKLIELYLFNDTLIKASVYYDINKNDFRKRFYFNNNFCFLIISSPRCMRISLDHTGEEYIIAANELIKMESNN